MKVDKIIKISNDFSICSSFYYFSAVSMVIQKDVSPKNDHFNLKFCISISICQTLLIVISLKLSFFYGVPFFRRFLRRFFVAFKNTWNISRKTNFNITSAWNKILKIWDIILLPLLSSFKTSYRLGPAVMIVEI